MLITSSTTTAETKIANKLAGSRGRTVRRREGGGVEDPEEAGTDEEKAGSGAMD